MKNIILTLSVISALFSCNNDKIELYKYNTLQEPKYDINDNKLIFIIYAPYIYLNVNEYKKAKLSPEELDEIYDTFYKDKFKKQDFLYKILNLKDNIPLKYFSILGLDKKIFDIDDKLLFMYKEKGVIYLKENYTFQNKEHSLEFRDDMLSTSEKETIIYLFYINFYQLHEDDYSARKWFEKKDEYLLFWEY